MQNAICFEDFCTEAFSKNKLVTRVSELLRYDM